MKHRAKSRRIPAKKKFLIPLVGTGCLLAAGAAQSATATLSNCPGTQNPFSLSRMTTAVGTATAANSSSAAPLSAPLDSPCETYGANGGYLQTSNGISLGDTIVQNGGTLTVASDGLVNGVILAGNSVQDSTGVDGIRGGGGTGNVITIAGGGMARGILTGANTTLTVGADGDPAARIGWIASGGTTVITNTDITPNALVNGIALGVTDPNLPSYIAGLMVNAGSTTLSNSTVDAASGNQYGVLISTDPTAVAGTASATTAFTMTGSTVTGNEGIFITDQGVRPSAINISNSHVYAVPGAAHPTGLFGSALNAESIGSANSPTTITLADSDFHGAVGMTLLADTAGTMTLNATGSTFESTSLNNYSPTAAGAGVYLGGAVNVTLDKSATAQSSVAGLKDGILVNTLDGADAAPTVRLLNGTTVQGNGGAAIHVVNTAATTGQMANILIASGSTLTGSNGNILQVDTGGAATVTADAVNLNGNTVVTGAASRLNLGLDHNAAITGDFSASNGATLVVAPVDAAASNFNLAGNVTADAATATVGLGGRGVLTGDVMAGNASSLTVQGTGAAARLNGAIRADASTVNVELSGGAQANGGLAMANGATSAKVLVDGAGSMLSNAGGSAISLDGTGTSANIYLQNGGRLDAGAGNPLVNVTNAALANVTLDNTTQAGDMTQDATGQLNVALQNNASLTGNLATTSLAVNSGATWNMGGQTSQSVGALTMNGGTIDFNSGTGPFKTLTASSLNGSGNFNMAVDFAPGTGNDQLVVNGQANGTHAINANAEDQGVENPRNNIPVVLTQGGNGQFAIAGDGGKVDAGIYTYTLQKTGDNWVLVRSGEQPVDPTDPVDPTHPVDPDPTPEPEDLSPAAKTALSMSAALPYAFYGELGTLRQRQGDLRMNKTDSGLWARSYSTFNQLAKSSAPPFQLNQYGGAIGADKRLLLSSGDLYVGGFGSYSYNTLDIDGGSSGRINSYGGGAYATWMMDNGWYLDSVLKANNFDNELRVVGSNGRNSRGKYSTPGFGGSIELGKHIDIGNKGFIEPYMQWAGFVARSANETLDSNFRIHYGSTKSVQGELGMLAGSNFELKNGVIVQPYIKGAVIREFINNNKVTLNGTAFTQDMSGNRMLVGLGVASQIKPNLQVHLDTDYSTGGPVSNSVNINFGVRYAF